MGANDKQGKQIIRMMGTDLPGSLGTRKALAKIKGIGQNLSATICARMNLDSQKAVNSYSDGELKELEAKIKAMDKVDSWQLNRQNDYDSGSDKHLLTTDLKLQLNFDKKRLSKIKSYRGLRLQTGHPVRGQRTKAHFRKGGKAVGVKRKKK
jgi:small subunit ribosomal protein S13